MAYDYDLFVIGAGSGGVRASRMSARAGARVGVAESTYLGGTCVNVGCVPKKLFVYGAHFAEEFEDAAGFGWQVGERQFHWPTLRDNKTKEIERLNGIYENLLNGAGVTIHRGHARFVDAHTLEVDGTRVTADRILIASGSRPFRLDVPGAEHTITSNEAFYLPEFPGHATVIGGGYIAVEFAGIFNGLGADTHLLYRGPLFLRGFDSGVREFVRDELVTKGIHLHFDAQVTSVSLENGRKRLHLSNGDSLLTDLVLCAIGRVPNTEGLGLENCGVALTEHGAVRVDDYFQTSVENIYAIGDVIDRMQLTPVAIAEGMCIANNLFGTGPKRSQDYSNVATAVFCQPNIGTVGVTEDEARALYPIRVFETDFRAMKHTLTGRQEHTYMKLIVRQTDDRVVGAHMVGPDAGEIIQGLAVAMKAGATKAHFDATVGIHPTAAEEFVTMREAAR
ncbi:MAG: glutathione-disulfide reductase [Pseudomonadales bacterium]|nr:glutathione-disulfide reductase [Pseudomonadales bacterium]MCP5185762.1 glutathione-disulfide reductase [Pseudomonadales bacterium]